MRQRALGPRTFTALRSLMRFIGWLSWACEEYNTSPRESDERAKPSLFTVYRRSISVRVCTRASEGIRKAAQKKEARSRCAQLQRTTRARGDIFYARARRWVSMRARVSYKREKRMYYLSTAWFMAFFGGLRGSLLLSYVFFSPRAGERIRGTFGFLLPFFIYEFKVREMRRVDIKILGVKLLRYILGKDVSRWVVRRNVFVFC